MMVHTSSRKFNCKFEIRQKELVSIYIFHFIYNTNISEMF